METTATTSNNIPIARTGKSLEAQNPTQRKEAENIWKGRGVIVGEAQDPPSNACIGGKWTGSLRLHPRPNPNSHRVTVTSTRKASHKRFPGHLPIPSIIFLPTLSQHSTCQHGRSHLFPSTTRNEKLLQYTR